MSRTPSPDRIAAHLRRLREDPQSVNPPGWRADFADGPWPVKVHRGGERVPPSGALARVLAGAVAVTAVRGPRATLRRAVPSGGAMHPTETYVVAAERLWHVDPYRMELLALPGSPGARLRAGLRLAPDAPLPAVVLLLTSRFWKNFYKYGEFSYRLGAVDAGVVLGRLMRLSTAEFGPSRVWTDFADDTLNTSLGVDGRDESVYAVVGCGPATRAADPAGDDAVFRAADGAGAPPLAAPELLERSRRIKRSPMFDLVHASARATPLAADLPATPPPATQPAAAQPATAQPAAAQPATAQPATAGPTTAEPPGFQFDAGQPQPPRRGAVALPAPVAVDPADPAVIVRRRSGGAQFTGAPADPAQLATVLRHGADAVTGLLRCGDTAPATSLYVAVHRVRDIPPGWYAHDRGRLTPAGRGPDPALGPYLQAAMFGDGVNAELAAFTVHVAASPRYACRSARHYRTQQLAVGVAMDAVILAATAAGLGNHPFLGFDAPAIDAAYGLDGHDAGTQAQICVGAVRAGLDWEVTVRHG
ncbi:hypothetical protein [Krasilnikovia sp. MM14-A1259]|uniref:hypothetical protein n=1 Tax=Krasilnikovia sp. MM14-A1259 TaxID=3373539 RepID=UPI003812BAAF